MTLLIQCSKSCGRLFLKVTVDDPNPDPDPNGEGQSGYVASWRNVKTGPSSGAIMGHLA